MSKKVINLTEHSKRFGKPDVERLGIFIEMPYLDRKERKSQKVKTKKRFEEKRPLVYPGILKTKCGNMDGYFDNKFIHIFQGTNKDSGKKKESTKKQKLMHRPLIPPGFPKKISSPGDYYGTFSGKIPAFSGGKITKRKTGETKFNLKPITTNPAKKGNCGYVDITIGKYPQYMSQLSRKTGLSRRIQKKTKLPVLYAGHENSYFDLNPFADVKMPKKQLYTKPTEKKYSTFRNQIVFVPAGPGKKKGGCMCGGFSRYPEHVNPRERINKKKKEEAKKPTFYPQNYAEKTMFTKSILKDVEHKCNARTFNNFKPQYTKNILATIY